MHARDQHDHGGLSDSPAKATTRKAATDILLAAFLRRKTERSSSRLFASGCCFSSGNAVGYLRSDSRNILSAFALAALASAAAFAASAAALFAVARALSAVAWAFCAVACAFTTSWRSASTSALVAHPATNKSGMITSTKPTFRRFMEIILSFAGSASASFLETPSAYRNVRTSFLMKSNEDLLRIDIDQAWRRDFQIWPNRKTRHCLL